MPDENIRNVEGEMVFQEERPLVCMYIVNVCMTNFICANTLWFKKNVPTLADYNYDPVQSILIIFSKLFVNDHRSCLVVKFSTSPHICCHYTL